MDAFIPNELLARYLKADLATNTKLAYSNDVAHFRQWGGTIPASADMVAMYLATYAGVLAAATLTRRVVAIHHAHIQHGHISPIHHALVKATMQGIKRVHGSAQRKVMPIYKTQLEAMVDSLHGLKGKRDKALLLIGFAGAFRRSELVRIQVEDLNFVTEGVVIRLVRSKTDQEGVGHDVAIPYIKGKYCAVKALKQWLRVSAINHGAVFRGITRYGKLSNKSLSPQSVALLIKHYAKAIGIDWQAISGHSLRVGLVTNAVRASADNRKIRQQTRHQSDAMLQRYIRDTELFINHPVKAIWSG